MLKVIFLQTLPFKVFLHYESTFQQKSKGAEFEVF